MDKFLINGNGLLLAYDQGFEHGPSDFNAKNVDPKYILDIARDSGVFTGVIFQKGIAEKYYAENKKQETRNNDDLPPLIVKLNGKTNLHQEEEPFAPLLCTVDEALGLGASAVGYTVYVGSEREDEMTATFSQVVKECNQKGIPTIGWFYLRGKQISDPHDPAKLAYAARLALELGADGVKLQFVISGDEANDLKNLKWIVQNAGKCKVFISGGSKTSDEGMFSLARIVKMAGCAGMAVGRNIWQRDNPVEFSKEISRILYS
jgi:class I fructose-bisphosphate aldolase